MPEARHEMIVDNAGALHKGIASCGAKKAEATLFKIRAYFISFLSAGRDVLQSAPLIFARIIPNHSPEIVGEAAEFFLNGKKVFRI